MEKFLTSDAELEFRLQDSDPATYTALFEKLLLRAPPQIISSVSLLADGQVHEHYIEAGRVVRSEARRKTEKYARHITIGAHRFKISVAREQVISGQVVNPQLVRIKQRYRFDLGDWFADFTVVKPGPANIANLQKTRAAFFERFTGRGLPALEANEKFEFELEAKVAMTASIADAQQLLRSLLASNAEETLLARVARMAGKERRGAATLKNSLPNAIELTKSTFIRDLWPRIANNEFAVVDKADGERMLLHLHDDAAELHANDGEPVRLGANPKRLAESIFECEVVDGVAYIYDVLMLNGEVLADLPFRERWRPTDLGLEKARFKEYTFLTEANYAAAIEATLSRTLYEMDGIIFSSVTSAYPKMLHYKWKPIEKMSIDLLCKRAPSKKGSGDVKSRLFDERALAGSSKPTNVYYLFASIRPQEMRMMNIAPLREYAELFGAPGSQQLVPVHFCPSSRPELYKYVHDGPEDLHDQIVEFGYKECLNVLLDTVACLRFMRIRLDRQDDHRKGGYFGNYFSIAEMVWNNFEDPLTLQLLLRPAAIVDELYFQQASSEYETMRKFNNSVKRAMIGTLASRAEWVLDMACGKGQDLLKYRDAGVRNVIMVDSVADNLSNVIARKRDILDGFAKREGPRSPFGIYTVRRDLLGAAEDTYRLIMNAGIKFSRADLVVCNLAIHYLMGSREQIANTVNMFSLFLAPGKSLMITSLDGRVVFDLVKKKNFASPSGKFIINRLWGDDEKFTGIDQRIAIKLPFAADPMEEPLVNYSLLQQLFKKHKIEMVKHARFTDICDATRLPAEQRFYADLHCCAVFKKKEQ